MSAMYENAVVEKQDKDDEEEEINPEETNEQQNDEGTEAKVEQEEEEQAVGELVAPLDESDDILSKGASEGSGSLWRWETLAPALWRRNRLRRRRSPMMGGEQQTKRLSRKAPELPQIERRNYLLHSHFIKGDIDACRGLIKDQLDESEEQCEYALYTRGLLLRVDGRIQESLDVFQQCALLNPTNGDYVKQIGRSLFLMGRQKAALDVFEEAQKLKADDWEIYHWKGRCHYHLKDNGTAKDCLLQAWKLRKHEESFKLLGKIAQEEGDTVTAIEAYRRALEVAPEDTALLTTLGLLYLETGSQQQAFEALGRALSLDAQQPAAILAAGAMMQRHGDYDVALTKYRVAVIGTPDSAQLWSNIAMCFYGKKKFVAAISCLKRANYLAPLDWRILYNLGLVHLAMQQYCSAFHFVSAAINLQPNAATLYMTLAVILTHLEDYPNAKQAHERAVSLDKVDPGAALNYAVFNLKRGDRPGAAEWYTNYESRLINAKSSRREIDQEVIDMGDKLRNSLKLDSPGDTETNLLGGSTPAVPGTATTRLSSEGDDTSLRRLEAGKAETESIASLNSRLATNDDEAVI